MVYGLNSPCEATATRTASGWLMLAASAALALFYVLPLKAALTPSVDEGYRRNFITREFGAYPTSPVFKGENGLGYKLGTTVVLNAEKPRLILSRYDWLGWDEEGPYMRGMEGRLFLHMEDRVAAYGRSLRLSLGFVCAMPRGAGATLTVTVNDTKVGTLPCRRGAVTAHFTVPAGTMGLKAYDQITISRAPDGWWERVKTRLGLRYSAVALEEIAIRPRP